MSSILSSAELTLVVNEVRGIIGDSTIGTTITYCKYSGTTVENWYPTIGVLPAMYSESSVSAFKGGYKPDEVRISNGLLALTDVKFIIMRDDVSGVLSVNDRIVEPASNYQSGTTYEIKSINRDPLAICYFIQARSL